MKNIKTSSTNKVLSANGGLLLLKNLITSTKFTEITKDCIPTLKSGFFRNSLKLKHLIIGFGAGAQCLDDMTQLAKDSAFIGACEGKVYSAKAYGDVLREFSHLQCKELNHKLTETAYQLRLESSKPSESITFDLDSTLNQQYGLKMEGVEAGYSNFLCLNTIQMYDDKGFVYWSMVRSGATHTSQSCLEIVHDVFSRAPKELDGIRKYFRADSGYCTKGLMAALSAKNVGFVICGHHQILDSKIDKIRHWYKEDFNDKNRIRFKDGREVEIGEAVYHPKGAPKSYRVIIIRSLKHGIDPENPGLFVTKELYDYYGWVTSTGDAEMSAREVVLFYRKRGHAENYIRDMKNGFDMHHYPCQKLIANKAYGILAAFAYNYMRFLAVSESPEKPHFTKAVRTKLINIPCEVVARSRDVVFLYMKHHLKEVRYWLNKIKNLQNRFEISCFT